MVPPTILHEWGAKFAGITLPLLDPSLFRLFLFLKRMERDIEKLIEDLLWEDVVDSNLNRRVWTPKIVRTLDVFVLPDPITLGVGHDVGEIATTISMDSNGVEGNWLPVFI